MKITVPALQKKLLSAFSHVPMRSAQASVRNMVMPRNTGNLLLRQPRISSIMPEPTVLTSTLISPICGLMPTTEPTANHFLLLLALMLSRMPIQSLPTTTFSLATLPAVSTKNSSLKTTNPAIKDISTVVRTPSFGNPLSI